MSTFDRQTFDACVDTARAAIKAIATTLGDHEWQLQSADEDDVWHPYCTGPASFVVAHLLSEVRHPYPGQRLFCAATGQQIVIKSRVQYHYDEDAGRVVRVEIDKL